MTAAPAPIEVRRYGSIGDYQADAASMAAAGWWPVGQVEATGDVQAGWIVAAIVALALGVVGFSMIAMIVVAVICFLLAFGARHKLLVVTYRPTMTSEKASPEGEAVEPSLAAIRG